MSAPDKCPHCGAEQEIPFNIYGWECGTIGEVQTDLCRERAAHAATRKKLEECKANNKRWQSLASGQIKATAAELSELETLRARVRKLEGLKIVGAYRLTDRIQVVVHLPFNSFPEIDGTIGEAMPRKEEK